MTPKTPETADPRRWWTLVVLCLVAARDRARQHDPQRRAADAAAATSAHRARSCSGSSTPTCSSSPACCSPPARSATASAASGRSRSGSPSSASARSVRRWPASPEMLIATRALMGIGGAFIMPSTLSILTADVPRRTSAAKAIGIWAGVSGLGIAIGPVAGGWLIEHAELELRSSSSTCRSSPLALLAGRWLVPESRDPSAPAARHPRLRPLDRRPDRARVGHHRGAVATAGPTRPILAAFAVAAAMLGRLRRLGAAHAASRCSTSACSATRASPARAPRSRWRSSRMFGVDLLPHPVPAGRARLLRARGRRARRCRSPPAS